MKKIFTALLLLTITLICWGQENVKIIDLDFGTKKFSGLNELENLKRGDFYKLIIKNINMNLYKVNVTKKDSIKSSDIKFPIFDLTTLGGVNEILSELSQITFSEITKMDKSDLDQINQLAKVDYMLLANDSLKPLTRNETIFGIINSVNKSTIKNESKSRISKKVIKERIGSEKGSLEEKLNLIKSLYFKIDNLSLDIQKKILSYMVIDTLLINYKELSGRQSFESILAQIAQFRTEIKDIIGKIEKQLSTYNKFESDKEIKNLIESDEELTKANQILSEGFSKGQSSAGKLYESINSEKVSSWINSLVLKENNAGFSYSTLPQQLNGNQAYLNISIIPQKEEYGLPSYQTKIKFPQWSWTFVGLGLSFYYACFANEVYSISATVIDSTTTEYRIVDEENENWELGIASLLHFGIRPYKDHDWFALNLVAGSALSITNKIKPRIIIGGGFSFGRKQLLSINALCLGGYVDKKSNAFSVNGVYTTKPEQVTVSKPNVAFGLSLGYIYKF